MTEWWHFLTVKVSTLWQPEVVKNSTFLAKRKTITGGAVFAVFRKLASVYSTNILDKFQISLFFFKILRLTQNVLLSVVEREAARRQQKIEARDASLDRRWDSPRETTGLRSDVISPHWRHFIQLHCYFTATECICIDCCYALRQRCWAFS